MTDVKISELPAADSAHADDRLEASQVESAGFVSKSITLDQVTDLVADSDQISDVIDGAITTTPGAPPIVITGWPFLPLSGGTLSGALAGTSAAFSGEITAATPTVGDNDTSVATTEFVTAAISAIPPTGSLLTGFWNANTAAIVPPPASGRVRLSVVWPPTLGASIHLYIHNTDVDGFTYTWALGPNVNDLVVLRSASGARLDGTVTARTVSTYIDVTITVTAVSGTLANNSRCQLAAVQFIGNYLPLAGGTLTGALAGTSATFSGNISAAKATLSSTLGIGVAARTSTPIDAMNLADSTGFTNIAFLRQANNPAATNYTQLIIEQNATNVVNLEVADQANAKGTLALQPFGGTVNIPALTGTTATFSGTVAAPGAQIQMVSTQTGGMATATQLIPQDDTIPQQTEGDQYMTLAITPKSATSKLLIEVVWVGACSVVSTMAVALFQDSAANALATVATTVPSAHYVINLKLTHSMTSGTTSATTFKVRAGGNTAGTTTFNGSNGARLYGGVCASSIVIREVAT